MTCALIRLSRTKAPVHQTLTLRIVIRDGRARGSRRAINLTVALSGTVLGASRSRRRTKFAFVIAATGEQCTKEKRRNTEDKHDENERLTSKQFNARQFNKQQTLT